MKRFRSYRRRLSMANYVPRTHSGRRAAMRRGKQLADRYPSRMVHVVPLDKGGYSVHTHYGSSGRATVSGHR